MDILFVNNMLQPLQRYASHSEVHNSMLLGPSLIPETG